MDGYTKLVLVVMVLLAGLIAGGAIHPWTWFGTCAVCIGIAFSPKEKPNG